MSLEIDRVQKILARVKCPFDIVLTNTGEDMAGTFLQVGQADGVCNRTQQKNWSWKGRKWYVSPHATTSEIIQTCFKACLTATEHELRENFLVDGVSVLDPHLDLEKLIDFRKREDALSIRAGA